jgi:hypothetical protein
VLSIKQIPQNQFNEPRCPPLTMKSHFYRFSMTETRRLRVGGLLTSLPSSPPTNNQASQLAVCSPIRPVRLRASRDNVNDM